MNAEQLAVATTEYGHGHLFGREAASVGARRLCPYLPQFAESIRGWYDGWDEWWDHRPAWEQKERKPA